MKWVLQQSGYELGNFLMMTPALRLMSEQNNLPVPVFFQIKQLSALFQDCPFIEVLSQRPSGAPRCTSKPPRGQAPSNVLLFIKTLCGKIPDEIPGYYIDSKITYPLQVSPKKRIAIFHGCLGRYWQHHKTLPEQVRQYMLHAVSQAGLQPVLVGSKADKLKFWNMQYNSVEENLGVLSLRDAVSVVAQCDGFISNDTGMYHVAAALQKPGLVLWKKTDPNRNKASCECIQHAVSRGADPNVYNEAIDSYLKGLTHGND